ncbi:MAG: excinuclease ABC subunit UvrA [Mycoplasma sp.]|nr:excinuclease ABC subunit UvrA [Mycoplasma sp.]
MKKESQNYIIIKGAKQNNLQNIDVKIPKNKLVVMTGVSGSGKSSLAFKTIYEEGRRRYVDSLSSYARQFLGGTEKPDVESIDGLSPAISIEQKTTHNNPRSTVGTVTEIYDYLRLLYARIGIPYCPRHKIKVSGTKFKDIVNKVLSLKKDSKLIISAPIVSNEKGTHAKTLEKLKIDGFVRVKINNEIYQLEDEIKLEKNKKHNIDVIVDRVVLNDESRSRISEGIEIALEHGNGLVKILNVDTKEEKLFSRNNSCKFGDFDMPKIEPKLFSFNSPSGMCQTCKGLGHKLKPDRRLLIPNERISIEDGGIDYFKNTVNTGNLEWQQFKVLLDYYEIPIDEPIENFSEKEMDIIINGSLEEIEYNLKSRSGNNYEKYGFIEGVGSLIERRFLETTSEGVRQYYKKFMSQIKCSKCNGARLNEYGLSVKIAEKNIYEFTKLSIEDALEFVINLELDDVEKKISTLIINELVDRLTFLSNVGLEYMTLNRSAETLSGGEAQRIRLATQIGSNLTGVLYVLDEPSIGLHQKDNDKLIDTLKTMRDIGNTLIIVEHDEETIKNADYIVDIGPKAGENGGQLVGAGSVEEITNNPNSITGQFLSGERKIEVPKSRRSGNGKKIVIKGASENNLKNINVTFPLGKFISLTGVSGSGKSTLMNEILYKSIRRELTNPHIIPGKHKSIEGINNVDKIVSVSQSPIGRTPRSNPATYTSVFDDIRDIFANTNESKVRGYKKGRFSFNVDGGRCDNCRGDGFIKVEMHFLPDVYVKCDHCDGKRYNAETLEVKYRTKSISDVLEMNVEEALEFFINHPKIKTKLSTLFDVGLGYIKLGQPATTLSGGEAQRVKLATFLQKKPTGKTIYVLDEPTTGLHSYDVQKLLVVLDRIVNNGDTVIVIEHNLDVIKYCDYIIDLGHDGGKNGGKIIAKGTPEQVAKVKESYTGNYLERIL